ncbi:hypothetical protein M8J77_018211 [Diaphorina citri]|nr:hypothetical protein M8J77_018211 [Diaphorina citri]
MISRGGDVKTPILYGYDIGGDVKTPILYGYDIGGDVKTPILYGYDIGGDVKFPMEMTISQYSARRWNVCYTVSTDVGRHHLLHSTTYLLIGIKHRASNPGPCELKPFTLLHVF